MDVTQCCLIKSHRAVGQEKWMEGWKDRWMDRWMDDLNWNCSLGWAQLLKGSKRHFTPFTANWIRLLGGLRFLSPYDFPTDIKVTKKEAFCTYSHEEDEYLSVCEITHQRLKHCRGRVKRKASRDWDFLSMMVKKILIKTTKSCIFCSWAGVDVDLDSCSHLFFLTLTETPKAPNSGGGKEKLLKPTG